ncbi:MAG: hypothetical protein U1B80_06610 [Anaerolineaceae bacterium]|nr:hypothetical protein [Anaerolineaceae bacterium]
MLKRLASSFNVVFPLWSVPLALLAVCILGFGLLIPSLGFYSDDWPAIISARTGGSEAIKTFFAYDTRPTTAWIYLVSFRVLGFQPLHWHLMLLVVRWLNAVVVWLLLHALWFPRNREAILVAALYAIYPAFLQQPMAVAYTAHWFSSLFFFLSLWTMVLAYQKPARFWWFYSISLATSLVHLLTSEYFVGAELYRPIILWLVIPLTQPGILNRTVKILKAWLPFLVIVAGFLAWRLFLVELPIADRNAPHVLYGFFSNPLSSSVTLVQFVVRDFMMILVGVWFRVMDPETFNLFQPQSYLSWGMVVISGVPLGIYLLRLKGIQDEHANSDRKIEWLRSTFFLGAAVIFFSGLSGWSIGRSMVENSIRSDRFGFAGTIGACLVIIAALEMLIENHKNRLVVLCCLVGLAVGFQLRNTNEYRWSWTKQTRFYWQLAWRAPGIQPQTTFLSDGEIFPKMGIYPTSFAINVLYPNNSDPAHLNYWFYSLHKYFSDQTDTLVEGKDLIDGRWYMKYFGKSQDSLALLYEPENGYCLWVLDPQDGYYPIPQITCDVLPVSNLSRIDAEGAVPGYPPQDIFGPEPERGWCYYYQKADLARQQRDWSRVAALWEEASRGGYSPNQPVEMVPFIMGFAHTGDWQRAIELTNEAYTRYGLNHFLCPTWEIIQESTPASPQRDDASQQVQELLKCGQ